MPQVTLNNDLVMHYEDHYFGEPWLKPEVVLMVHGVAESGRSWDQWVPHLSRQFRVIRPDLRGFGQSSKPQPGFVYTPDGYAEDLALLLTALGIEAAHVVGAKIGGTITLQFAADYPQMTRSAAVFSGPVRSRNTGGSADLTTFQEIIKAKGVRGWAAETQRARLGTEASDQLLDYWTDFMGQSDPTVNIDIQDMVMKLDISAALVRIEAPVLVGTTERSALASVEVVREWQQLIAGSELAVLPGDSSHVAAVRPDDCAQLVLDFIRRRASTQG